ncbi:class I SAM-dependent methyltransferase [Flexivirga meconopsidis]|uniref:class I SAM-dependent methyltransferase n=1 Tax=Flexivirga meconopsidis TaxID=2977121 RepID=UPI00223FD8DA|nr:class I SAM-dependent methyltransferase [Flexivirga meconopsidis]
MEDNGFLHRYYLNNPGRLMHKWIHYFDIYEDHFSRYRGTDVRFLEIGVGRGGSQQMWRDYFGPDADIVCLDLEDLSDRVDPKVATFYQGDETDTTVLQRIVDEHGPLDVVLDDGSHISSHMVKTFEFLYPTMAPDGVYMIEDVHASYSPPHEGGYKRAGTIIEYTKDLLDRLNFTYVKELPRDDKFGRTTQGIHIYDSIIAFERRPKAHPQWLITGGSGRLGDWAFQPRPPVHDLPGD